MKKHLTSPAVQLLFLVASSCFLLTSQPAAAQPFFFAKANYSDTAAFEKNIVTLAQQVISKYQEADKNTYYDNLFRLMVVAKAYDQVEHTLNLAGVFRFGDSTTIPADGFPYRLYSVAMMGVRDSGQNFDAFYDRRFSGRYRQLNYDNKMFVAGIFNHYGINTRENLAQRMKSFDGSDSLSLIDALALCRDYCSHKVYSSTKAAALKILDRLDNEDYIKSDSVLLNMPDGGTVALTVVRDKKTAVPGPVVLMYGIYAGDEESQCKDIVQKGYTGVVADTRGKRLSLDPVEPLEHDARDAWNIIDWISKQPWCNGKVGMYGGSYLGFSQWSAMKYLHPALKTIVPQVAVGAGIDFPSQNGVFITSLLRWLHHVMDTRLTEYTAYGDTAKWNKFFDDWYRQGKSLRSLDTLEGRPNAIYQRWLSHPGYDNYWQDMTPQKQEYAKINIPILTITGYWDDDQLGAMYYYHQYQKWNKHDNHYLLIGPYDHYGAQGSREKILFGYTLDSVANVSIDGIVFQWLDYILKDSARPAILQDKVNFEVMGENKWRHVPSLDQMHNDTLRLYLGNLAVEGRYPLLDKKPKALASIAQQVDLADRSVIYPKGDDINAFATLIDSSLNPEKEKLMFVSDPVDKPYAISGALTANILATVNKKDMDLVLDLYEQTPDGHFMALNEVVQRASYAKDIAKRQLLRAGQPEHIVLQDNYITSKRLERGSRIIILLGVNKNPAYEINYGTGKDVSAETIKDAAVPMQINWYNSSYITLPILR
jgi:uncharacterized protein